MAQCRLGILPYSFAHPFAAAVRSAGELQPGSIALRTGSSIELSLELQQGNLDGALLSPIEYAKRYSRYQLLPDVGIVSEGESRLVLLEFRERSHTIRKIGFNPGSGTEVVLAHLVLKEKHGIAPQFIPMPAKSPGGGVDAMLLVGDAAQNAAQQTNTIDLVDEWSDITGYPFVHALWVTREIEDSILQALGVIFKRIDDPSINDDGGKFPTSPRFTLDRSAIDGLSEFYRMAFYHGILEDIPDLNFLHFDDTSHQS